MKPPVKKIHLVSCLAAMAGSSFAVAEVNQAEQIAPDVYFHEGDIKGHGHCNNGWIVFED